MVIVICCYIGLWIVICGYRGYGWLYVVMDGYIRLWMHGYIGLWVVIGCYRKLTIQIGV